MPGAVTLMLGNPIEVESTVHNALPDGTGNGLSAFYYALLLLLAGFTGSIVVSMLVDSMLGFVPAEFGPVYRFAEQVKISRFRTLLIKWALMVVLALLTSGAYMLIAAKMGMPIQHSSAVVALRGIRDRGGWCHVHVADRGAGRTRPAGQHVRLRHPRVAVGGRHGAAAGHAAVLRLAGEIRADAPSVLGRAGVAVPRRPSRCRVCRESLEMTAVGLVIGLLLGGIVTRLYDRRGYHRIPPGLEADGDDWGDAYRPNRARYRRATTSRAAERVAANTQRPNVIGLRLNRHATVIQVSCVIPVVNAVLVAPTFAPKGQPCRLSPPPSGASQPAAPG